MRCTPAQAEAIAFALGGGRRHLRGATLKELVNYRRAAGQCPDPVQVTLRLDELAALQSTEGTNTPPPACHLQQQQEAQQQQEPQQQELLQEQQVRNSTPRWIGVRRSIYGGTSRTQLKSLDGDAWQHVTQARMCSSVGTCRPLLHTMHAHYMMQAHLVPCTSPLEPLAHICRADLPNYLPKYLLQVTCTAHA